MPEQNPSPQSLERWLEIATHDLCDEARARVRAEIENHIQDAIAVAIESGIEEDDAHREACRQLGSPKKAAKQFKKTFLLKKEEQSLERLRSLRNKPFWNWNFFHTICFALIFFLYPLSMKYGRGSKIDGVMLIMTIDFNLALLRYVTAFLLFPGCLKRAKQRFCVSMVTLLLLWLSSILSCWGNIRWSASFLSDWGDFSQYVFSLLLYLIFILGYLQEVKQLYSIIVKTHAQEPSPHQEPDRYA